MPERYKVFDWLVYDGDTVRCRVLDTVMLDLPITPGMDVPDKVKWMFRVDRESTILGVTIALDDVKIVRKKDSVHVVLRGKVKTAVRVDGVDTPELKGNQAVAGKVVRDIVRQWFDTHQAKGIEIVFHCRDKYAGRSVADFESDGESLSAYLLRRKLAKPYDGGTKEPWTKEELKRIADMGHPDE